MTDTSNKASTPPPMPRVMMTVKEFCQAYLVSRSKLYDMLAHGLGPAISKVGRRTLIGVESAERWRQGIEQPSGPREPGRSRRKFTLGVEKAERVPDPRHVDEADPPMSPEEIGRWAVAEVEAQARGRRAAA